MKKLVIALAIAATSTVAFAGPHAGRAVRGQRVARMQRAAEKLGLSDAQKQQIAAIHKASREANRQLIADLRAKTREFRQLKRANDPRAADLQPQLETLRDQAKAARKATHEQVLTVLTAEQRAQLDALRAARRHRS